MSKLNILATLQNHCAVPFGSICRGKDLSGKIKVDYTIDDTTPVTYRPPVSEKLKEVDGSGTVKFVKAGETIKTSEELKKEGKPVSKPPKVKVLGGPK